MKEEMQEYTMKTRQQTYFVRKCADIHGKTLVVYKLHALLNTADDLQNYDCSLNEISSFPFENHLQTLK